MSYNNHDSNTFTTEDVSIHEDILICEDISICKDISIYEDILMHETISMHKDISDLQIAKVNSEYFITNHNDAFIIIFTQFLLLTTFPIFILYMPAILLAQQIHMILPIFDISRISSFIKLFKATSDNDSTFYFQNASGNNSTLHFKPSLIIIQCFHFKTI